MVVGPENPNSLLHTADYWDTRRITAMKSNKGVRDGGERGGEGRRREGEGEREREREREGGREKATKETVEKTGSKPRENKESLWASTTFPERKKFMQVGKAGFSLLSVPGLT